MKNHRINNMESRICKKCMIEKPLTREFFGVQARNSKRFLTHCIECKKKYHLKWREDKKASQDPDKRRMKQLYVYKEYTEQEKEVAFREAYAYIYWQAFDKAIPLSKLNKITSSQLKKIKGTKK